MKIKKSISALLAVLFTLSFSGCQLAQKDAGEDSATAHIIGVFITTEYLDLFDAEAYLADQFVGTSTGDVNFSGNSDRYDGRYYATLQAITDLYGSESKTTYYQYQFPDLKGFAFFSANHPDSVDRSVFLASNYDSAISDIHTSIFVTDADERVELKGTLNLSMSYTNKQIFINPVYQTEDGSVYVESGDSFTQGGTTSEGTFMTQTISDTTTKTRNGESQSNANSVALSIAFVYPPEKIVVIQMDQNNEVVKRMEYQPGALPETLKPEATTEYIVVETHKKDAEGSPLVTREMYTKEDDAVSSYYARADGICSKQSTALAW
ncbi:MAG: hypothetical protein PHW41_07220 [Eubacteriales bacterium]|nr:hypothetical protein [Eubacteriales bacterium]